MWSKRTVYNYVLIFLIIVVATVNIIGCGGSSTPINTGPTPTPPPTDDKFGQEFQAIKNSLNVVTCKDVMPNGSPVSVTSSFPSRTSVIYALVTFKAEGTSLLKAYWYRDGSLLISTTYQLKGDKAVKFSILNRRSSLKAGNYKVEIAYCKTKEDKGYLLNELNFTIAK